MKGINIHYRFFLTLTSNVYDSIYVKVWGVVLWFWFFWLSFCVPAGWSGEFFLNGYDV